MKKKSANLKNPHTPIYSNFLNIKNIKKINFFAKSEYIMLTLDPVEKASDIKC